VNHAQLTSRADCHMYYIAQHFLILVTILPRCIKSLFGCKHKYQELSQARTGFSSSSRTTRNDERYISTERGEKNNNKKKRRLKTDYHAISPFEHVICFVRNVKWPNDSRLLFFFFPPNIWSPLVVGANP
jgi:hypothetical protein